MSLLADILADGATGLYQFDEPSGATATDHGTGGVNGAYVNTPTLNASPIVPGGPTHSASFAAASSQEMTSTGSSITTTGSIEVWFKWTAGSALVRDNTSAGGWIVGFDNGGTFAVRISGTTVNTSLATSAVRDGNLHQLVISKSGASATIYVDNVSVGTTASAGSSARTSPWHVARNGTAASYSDATFGILAFYVGTALSSGQVSSHYNSGTLAGAMTGTASATGAASGTLTGAAALSGSASAAGAGSGTLSSTGSGALSGSASAVGAGSGTLTATVALTGTSTATAGGSGALSQRVNMTGLAVAASDAYGFIHADLPVRITDTFMDRWASGQLIGAARPGCRVEVRSGRFNRRYGFWDNSGVPVDATVGTSDSVSPWQAYWEPSEPYKEIPSVRSVELAKTFDEKGIASATIIVDNIANLPITVAEEDGGGTYHQIHRGYLSPLRGFVADGRTRLLDERGEPVNENDWYGRLNRKRQITVWESYGNAEIKTFTGLIDDVDTTSNPAVITITARGFGQVLSDEEFFGWNIDKNLRDPVVFIDKDEADQIVKGGYGAFASSESNPASLVNDGDSNTYWLSGSHTDGANTEWVQIRVSEGRHDDIWLGAEFPDMDLYISIFATALADGSPPTRDDGSGPVDLTPSAWVDTGLGDVPGTFGGEPYVRLITDSDANVQVRNLDASYIMGTDSIIRVSCRNLYDLGAEGFRAAIRSLYSRKRTLSTETGANKWVRVGEVSDAVKVVLRWAGFKEWDVEDTGVRLKKRLLANRGMKYMDLIDTLKDGLGFEFFIADPTSADESIGIPTFRKTRVVDTGVEPIFTVTDEDLLTSVEVRETDEPRAYIIRARGRTSKTGDTLGGDTTKRIMYVYRPPWSGEDSAGVIRHVIHTDQLYTTADDVRFAAWYIGLQEALEAVSVGVQIPGFPGVDLDDIFVLQDLSTGLTTRLQVRERRSTNVRGENADWTMTLGGAITDTEDVQDIVALIVGSNRDG